MASRSCRVSFLVLHALVHLWDTVAGRESYQHLLDHEGGWNTRGEGKNLGAGPFDLEGSGFRANFKHQRQMHTPAPTLAELGTGSHGIQWRLEHT